MLIPKLRSHQSYFAPKLRFEKREYYASPPPYAPNVVNQTVDYGGVTWKGQPGGGWVAQSSTGGGSLAGQAPNTQDIINNAKAIRDFNIQSAQPAIATLQQQKTDLGTQYDNLLKSIQGNEQVANNQQTVATNAELARRGLDPNSGLGQQTLSQALQPIAAQYAGLTAQTGLQQNQDINSIANAIANLQSGNPSGALSTSTGIAGLQNQASQIAAQNQLAIAQAAQAQSASQYIPIQGLGVYDVANKNLLGGYSQTGLSPNGNSIVGVY